MVTFMQVFITQSLVLVIEIYIKQLNEAQTVGLPAVTDIMKDSLSPSLPLAITLVLMYFHIDNKSVKAGFQEFENPTSLISCTMWFLSLMYVRIAAFFFKDLLHNFQLERHFAITQTQKNNTR